MTGTWTFQTPTVVLLDEHKQFHSFGEEARKKQTHLIEGGRANKWYYFEDIKTHLLTTAEVPENCSQFLLFLAQKWSIIRELVMNFLYLQVAYIITCVSLLNILWFWRPEQIIYISISIIFKNSRIPSITSATQELLSTPCRGEFKTTNKCLKNEKQELWLLISVWFVGHVKTCCNLYIEPFTAGCKLCINISGKSQRVVSFGSQWHQHWPHQCQ